MTSSTVPTNPQHRREVTWQIFLPIVLASMVILGLSVWTAVAAAGQREQSSAWASVSAIFLITPVCLGGVVLFALIGAAVYGMNKLLCLLPLYTRLVQLYVFRAGIYLQIAFDRVAEPFLKVQSNRAAWQAFWDKILRKKKN